jgi:hypothetical protein
MGFYKSFLNLAHDEEKEIKGIENTVEGAIEFANSNVKILIRPQILSKNTEDYYIAFDTLMRRDYICFKEMLMLDIDCHDSYIFTDLFVTRYFDSFGDMCFAIHKSTNGYHVFVVSRKFRYDSKESIKFMLQNFCDFLYCCHSYTRGYSVRLSLKKNEKKPIYMDLGIHGNKKLIDDKLLKYTKMILTLSS